MQMQKHTRLICNISEIVDVNSFGVEDVPEEIKQFIWNKNLKANMFRVQLRNVWVLFHWIH